MTDISIASDLPLALPVSTPRVLVVEDDAGCRLVTTSYLELYGYTFDIAMNGKEAVKLAEKPYALILMDIQMSGLDGLEATRLIRDYEKTYHRSAVPIIGLTASAQHEDHRLCLDAGMNDCITKPFGFTYLRDRLDRFLSPRPLDAGV